MTRNVPSQETIRTGLLKTITDSQIKAARFTVFATLEKKTNKQVSWLVVLQLVERDFQLESHALTCEKLD